MNFVAVEKILEPCACCAHGSRRGPGVRVEHRGSIEFYYCSRCVFGLHETLSEVTLATKRKV